ncbi:ferredoxin [Desulfobotulus alkaliphilus]|uniref:Ferredoxin n=1 Tax=Desulfobotulus alkaliphilus TaxID=622671 RepID=A0A562RNQ4_9BACT|nr:ferredoxin [Desulfobotulus alkaliphilus]TWI70697.1 ferredoxin [Desulfobotulus alkaliphilus]
MKDYAAEVDLVTCIRCGICIELCPEAFGWSATGFVVVRESEGRPECLEEAIKNCPADCIRER